MTTAVQRRRGTSTEHSTFTGLNGEITVNTTTYTAHIHDGATAGGVPLAKADGSNIVTSSIDINGGTIDGTVIGGTTPAAVTTSSLVATTADINAGTIDGTVIGGSTAAAGTFTTITASGEITANGGIALGDGDVATFGDSDDLSIFHAGGTTYLTNTTGSLVLRTDSFRVLNTANSEQILHGDANGAVTAYYDNAAKLSTTATGIDVTGTATADKVTIGTSSASNGKLTLEGVDGSDSAGIYFNNTTATNGKSYSLSSGNSGEFMLYDRTSSAYRLFVSSAGNVGINVSSPTSPLHIRSAANVNVRFDDSGSSSYTWYMNDAQNLYIPNVQLASTHTFYANGQRKVDIDASGNLLVGTTSAVTGSVAGGFQVQNNSGNGSTINIGHPSGAASGFSYALFSYDNSIIGSIGQSGTTAVLYNTTSDQRLKENITDANDAGDKIDAIQVRQYDWKADGSHQDYGMVAQELMTVAPEAVSGDPESDEMMGVDYSKLVPMMLKEIQSLRARVAQLEGAN